MSSYSNDRQSLFVVLGRFHDARPSWSVSSESLSLVFNAWNEKSISPTRFRTCLGVVSNGALLAIESELTV